MKKLLHIRLTALVLILALLISMLSACSPIITLDNIPYYSGEPYVEINGGKPYFTKDELTTKGGTKTLKKRFIDRKIPQWERSAVPVIADDGGVLAVYGFGADETRKNGGPYVRIEFMDL